MDKILHHFEPLFVGFYRGIIIPGFLTWCRISSIHSSFADGKLAAALKNRRHNKKGTWKGEVFLWFQACRTSKPARFCSPVERLGPLPAVGPSPGSVSKCRRCVRGRPPKYRPGRRPTPLASSKECTLDGRKMSRDQVCGYRLQALLKPGPRIQNEDFICLSRSLSRDFSRDLDAKKVLTNLGAWSLVLGPWKLYSALGLLGWALHAMICLDASSAISVFGPQEL